MRDPRIDELLEHLDQQDSSGKPTRAADMARQVNDYLVEIEKLRSEVEVATRQVVYLTGRARSMEQSASGANALAPRVDEMEQELGYQRERMETVSANLKARQGMVKNTQQLISARITSVQKILDTFAGSTEKELSKSVDTAPDSSGSGVPAGSKKVIRRRRVVRRRR